MSWTKTGVLVAALALGWWWTQRAQPAAADGGAPSNQTPRSSSGVITVPNPDPKMVVTMPNPDPKMVVTPPWPAGERRTDPNAREQ